ncbi:hypothetical protein FIV06_15630 [Labrenzia sp. THAF191b]|uniref:hypothetical protein n=1 Tax=unclassified Labrenzia TaxID=2648686 RepID=UPI0012696901|nr:MULTISPECIES: hypothetical protein [unclassified Labrenzia]QFS98858.1 hypothetical protein FIV06_15630 [Labrenzia sp. THAF191b]QFT05172.1 hypothetical protein FIV05_15625 [Labrenzia sp. THAF191a]QFT16716.1 hypothetical protein FIV03_15640 [Labrenzia sp. THAF187b]
MTLKNGTKEDLFKSLFEGSAALSLDEQVRNILQVCERHDVMTFAKMVCLKRSGHQEILLMHPHEAQCFIDDIDLVLTAIMSQQLLKQ